jgi:hypothetical protein
MERIGGEVQRELTRTGSQDGVPLAALTEVWPGVVGETIARRAWPLRIGRDGTLHVATESATWANELSLLRDEILERLTARLGSEALSRLRFAVGPVPEPATAPPPSEAAVTPPQVPPEIESEAASAAETIEDPELRELVARAARTSLLKARSGRHFW